MTLKLFREASLMALEALDKASTAIGKYDLPGTQNWIVAGMQPAIQALQLALSKPELRIYGWSISGTIRIYMGEFAEQDAKAEAKYIGGTCKAFPIYVEVSE